MPDDQERHDSDRICITCGKPGGACRWSDDAETCMRGQLQTLRAALARGMNSKRVGASLESTVVAEGWDKSGIGYGASVEPLPDHAAKPTLKLSDRQEKCLMALACHSRPNGEYCMSFAPIASATDLHRVYVRRAVRVLRRKGLAEFHKGLFTEDGELAGAGYCISVAGLQHCQEIIDRYPRTDTPLEPSE